MVSIAAATRLQRGRSNLTSSSSSHRSLRWCSSAALVLVVLFILLQFWTNGTTQGTALYLDQKQLDRTEKVETAATSVTASVTATAADGELLQQDPTKAILRNSSIPATTETRTSNDNVKTATSRLYTFHEHEHNQELDGSDSDSDSSHSSNKCSLTVVVVDPRLAYFPANDTMYTKTLESVAEYVPANACIVFQMSICMLQKCLEANADANVNLNPLDIVYYGQEAPEPTKNNKNQNENQNGKVDDARPGFRPEVLRACNRQRPTTTAKAKSAAAATTMTTNDWLGLAASLMQNRSGPLLTERFWKRGRVRLAVLDHKAYGLASCDKFVSVNTLWLSSRYWLQEFVPGVDADRMLIMQRDGFLCKPLPKKLCDIDPQNGHRDDLAYVGSPWFLDWPWMKIAYSNNQTIAISNNQDDDEYSITAWRDYWKLLDHHYTGDYYDKKDDCQSLQSQVNNIACPLPSPLSKLFFPKTLPKKQQWVGNGGLSIRSRKWMLRMIRLCPKTATTVSHLFTPTPPAAAASASQASDTSGNTPAATTRLLPHCRVKAMQEDMFYSLLLTIAGAPIATLQQALLFGVDQDFGWPTSKNIVETKNDKNHYWVNSDDDDDEKEWMATTLQDEERRLGHFIPMSQHKCFFSFRKNGYGCLEKQHCKYSFNEDNRPTNTMGA